MTTAIDTNVVVALWDKDPTLSLAAQTALEVAFNRGSLVVSAPVFAELIAAPGRTETFVSSFLEETGIAIDWDLGEAVWRSAGRAFQGYAERRRDRAGTRCKSLRQRLTHRRLLKTRTGRWRLKMRGGKARWLRRSHCESKENVLK